MDTEDIVNHGRRIAELERQVADLYQRLGQGEPQSRPVFNSDLPRSPAEDPRISELLGQGNTIGAIKLYRELTGVGLAEAKDAVESISRG